jgi:predicted Rossmann-fold nucleotide-binding protein
MLIHNYLTPHPDDLTTPDGKIETIRFIHESKAIATVSIESIFDRFVGFDLPKELIFFNLKSTLAQLGLEGIGQSYDLNKKEKTALIEVELIAYSSVARSILPLLSKGAYIGKLFAADDRRKVRDPDYLMRMLGRSDWKGRPLLSLGGLEGGKELILEKNDGRTVAFLALQDGTLNYEMTVYSFLPTLAKALHHNISNTRALLHLHQYWEAGAPRIISPNEILLVKTAPLHIRTVHARVVQSLLPQGYHHTSANILQPDTFASGDIYELYGNSQQVVDDIPLEFFTLEPHKEHVFFTDRDQLIASLEDPQALYEAFQTAPGPIHHLAAVFLVKGTQLKALTPEDWVTSDPLKHEFPGLAHPSRQALLAEKYIENQPQYPFLKALETGLITSQGVLLCRHFPTPLLKRMLLNDLVARGLKRIYFQYPSATHGSFFSHEDRSLLLDLAKFGIPVYWVDLDSKNILQFVLRFEKDSGFFVPLHLVETFRKATFFGVYGSNLEKGNFELELRTLLQGILDLRGQVNHPLLSETTPLALVTGGGPGAMEVGNRVAKELGILSCANIVDFRTKGAVVNEQKQNSYIDAKMTYRTDRLVERQAEFYLDFPIVLPGGIGTDFEYALEEVRRKTGACPAHPVLLMGPASYWKEKITSRFQINQAMKTIQGSEWVSNCFYSIETAEQGLSIYKLFFENKLPIGKDGPIYADGFCPAESICHHLKTK